MLGSRSSWEWIFLQGISSNWTTYIETSNAFGIKAVQLLDCFTKNIIRVLTNYYEWEDIGLANESFRKSSEREGR